MLATLMAMTFIGFSQSPCLLGLAPNIPVKGGIAELQSLIQEERRLGCGMMAVSAKWSELEPTPGKIQLTKLANDLRNISSVGFVPMLTLQTIDTNNRTLPTDLMAESWDSPKMLQREAKLLQAISGILPKTIGAVMLGNEVDGYLPVHANEIDGFRTFLTQGKREIQTIKPEVKVGVTTMYTTLHANPQIIQRIQEGLDLVSMTYYPLKQDFSVLPVSDVPGQIKEMVQFAGTRQLFIQEAGYPASPLLGSSGKQQAAFVDAVFDCVTANRGHVLGVSFFLAIDLNDQLVNTLVGYYGVQGARVREYLASLGFKDQYGKARPAWDAFMMNVIASKW